MIAIVCELGSVASFPIALRGAFARIMPWRPAFALGLAEQGTNVLVPAGGTGGLAFGAVLLQRRGVPAAFAATRTVVLFLATSLMTFLAVIGAGVTIGLGADGGEVPAWAGFLLALAAATFLGFVALIGRVPTSTAEHQSSLRRLVTRLRNATADGVRATIMLLRRGDVLLIAGSIGYLAFDIAALAATFEALGGGAPSPAAFVLAYTIGQAGSLVPTPAGVGGTEGSLIGMFVLCGASLGAATAAVLAYRVLQLGIPALLGLLASIRRAPHDPHRPYTGRDRQASRRRPAHGLTVRRQPSACYPESTGPGGIRTGACRTVAGRRERSRAGRCSRPGRRSRRPSAW